jgi:carboxylate-amine ligase
VPHTDEPARLIEENMWRAIRYGLDGRMIDLRRADEYPAAEIGDRLLEWTAPVRAELGIEPALAAANGAQRQRRMIETGASMEDVYASVVRETRATYSEEVPA